MAHLSLVLLLFFAARAAQEGPSSRPAAEVAKLRAEAARLLEGGDAKGAVEAARSALARDGGAIETRLLLVRALLADRRTNDALEEIDLAKADVGETPDVLFHYGRAFLAKADSLRAEGAADFALYAVEDASHALRRVLEAQPDRTEASLLLAKARISVGDLDGAGDAIAAAQAAKPKAAGLEPLRGTIAFQRYFAAKEAQLPESEVRRLFEEARSALEKARRTDPDDPGPARGLGDLFLWEGKKDEARAAYEDALVLDPASVDLATVVPLLDPEEALAMISSARTRFTARRPAKPDADAPLLWYEGLLRFQAGEFARAKEAFEASARKNPSFVNAHYYAALASVELKDYDGAERAFVGLARANLEACIALLSQDEARRATLESTILYLADRAVRGEDEESARDLFRVAAGLSPDDADAWNNFAFLARNTGRAEEAVEGYRKALEIRPDDPQLLNALGVVLHYNLRRDPAEARALYEKAIAAAEAVLGNPRASEEVRREASTAKSDAERNLQRLKEGRTEPWR